MHNSHQSNSTVMVSGNGCTAWEQAACRQNFRASAPAARANAVLAKIAVAGLIALTSTACFSAPPVCDATAAIDKFDGVRPSYTQCMQTSLAVSAWRGCTATESAYQNKRLNKAYKALITKLDSGHQAKLRSDERIWIQYRDALCVANPYGLEQPESANLGCVMQEDARRASYLESLTSLAEIQG